MPIAVPCSCREGLFSNSKLFIVRIILIRSHMDSVLRRVLLRDSRAFSRLEFLLGGVYWCTGRIHPV